MNAYRNHLPGTFEALLRGRRDYGVRYDSLFGVADNLITAPTIACLRHYAEILIDLARKGVQRGYLCALDELPV